MNIENTIIPTDNLLNPLVTDTDGLSDFQKVPDKHGIAINKVGIEGFKIPLNFLNKETSVLTHDCNVNLFVYLKEGKTGVNMSRFCTILQEEAAVSQIDSLFFKKVLNRMKCEMRDYASEDLIKKAYLEISLNYATKQQSLKSNNWGWQYYPITMSGMIGEDNQLKMKTAFSYEYSSTCPCSLSLAKQYEKEYQKDPMIGGSGIAVAHGQRSKVCSTLYYDESELITIDEIIKMHQNAIPTETQSLVKRADEQAFAILNGENPMFVEHVAKRLSVVFNSTNEIINWNAKIEHFESLHSHNAVAYISKDNTNDFF